MLAEVTEKEEAPREIASLAHWLISNQIDQQKQEFVFSKITSLTGDKMHDD